MSKTKKIFLTLLTGAISLSAVYYGALIAIPNVVDLNKYKEQVSKQIETQTGFKVSCEDISFMKSLSPYLKIKMYHTIVLYPDDEIFIKLKNADLKVKIFPLIFKKIVIKDAKLTRPIINITLYKDLTTSLDKYINAQEPVLAGNYFLNSIISDTLCENYKIKFNDESINKTFYLEGNELVLKDIKLNDKAHLVLKGALYENKTEYLKYDLDLISTLTPKKKKFAFSPFKAIYDSDIKGEITGVLKYEKNNNLIGNISINNLYLKAEDTILSNNNATVIFKGEEAQIKSELHTSKTDIAKLEGKYNYGRKKYIELNANAKNVNLKNLYKLVSEVSKGLNIPNKYDGINITGLANADFSISSDFKKLKSSGTCEIKNTKIIYEKLPYKVENINANINFANNNINIENASLKVNTTPIKLTGKIDEHVNADLTASSENLDLKTITSIFLKDKEIPVNIVKGKLDFTSQITGNIEKTLNAKNLITIKDLKITDKKTNIPITSAKTTINADLTKTKYNGTIKLENLKTIYDKKQIEAPEFTVTFNEKDLKIPENQIKIINSPIQIKGEVKNYQTEPKINAEFSGKLSSFDAEKFVSEYIKQPHKAVGNLPVSGTITTQGNNTHIKMQLSADKNNYLSYTVIGELLNKPSVITFDGELNNKTLTIKELSLKENTQSKQNNINKIINISGQVINPAEPVLKNLRVQIPNTITASSNFLGGEDFSLNADLTLNNSINNPSVSGSAKIFYYNIKKYLTSIKNADISLSSQNIRVIAPDIQINTSKINLIADIAPEIKNNLIINNAQLNCSNLDLNSLYPIFEKNSNTLSNQMPTVKKGTATINNFQVLDLKAKDISNDFTIDKNILSIKNISGRAYGGSISGNINLDIPHNHLEIMLNGKNISMNESLYDLCKLSDNISGMADFNSNLSLLIGDYNSVIKSLNGKVDFKSVNGRMGTLGKFEHYLYAQNILYHGLLNTTLNRIAAALEKDNTAHYKYSEGGVLFQNGYMISNGIKTTGKDMSLYVTGRHNLLSNQANLDIYGRISDEIKNKLGQFGNVSISDLLSSPSQKRNDILIVNKEIIEKIPDLYNRAGGKTNTFKVNIFGDINSVNAINSFVWILPKEEPQQIIEQQEQEEKLPDFSDLQTESL